MHCSECGNLARKSAVFCDQCGSCLEQEEERIPGIDMVKMPDNILLQIEEIMEEKMICHHCGKQLKQGALFCKECGSRVSN